MLPDVVHDAGVLASSTDMEEGDRARSLLHIGRRSASGPPGFLVAPLTKPPVTALAAWKVHQADPDRSFLSELYPAIVRSQRWWFERSRPRGRTLPIYLHPYSSGIDDSPLWDQGMPVATPDLPAYLALQADHLALMADVLGRTAEAADWRSQAEVIVRQLVARHWRVRAGSFVSFHRGRRVPADTALGLIPLITGRLPPSIASRVVASLTDPGRFWPRFPVPSVALTDPEFDPATMWRGPTWLFIDFLLVDGLRRAGFPDVAERLRARALEMVESGHGTPEYYDPLDGTRPPRATAMFSGTAALYLDLLLADESASS
jgi:glycogen debranching enzyme